MNSCTLRHVLSHTCNHTHICTHANACTQICLSACVQECGFECVWWCVCVHVTVLVYLSVSECAGVCVCVSVQECVWVCMSASLSESELALNQRVRNAGYLWLHAMNNHKQAQGKDSWEAIVWDAKIEFTSSVTVQAGYLPCTNSSLSEGKIQLAHMQHSYSVD